MPASILCCDIELSYVLFYLFIYFRLHWVFVAVCGLSLVAVSRNYSSVVRRLLILVASLLEHRF